MITGLTLSAFLTAQVPSTCFEIESILVDACGSPEGENEMVRFVIGPTALNTSNLTINWPNNPYRGICQNATTAAAVAALNSTILGCGYLKEPVGGVLPAGSKALLITSENVDVTANSFANLNDTLIVIFQCVGNTQGHFANYNTSSGIRTLTMSFGSGCSDQVSYDRSLLINQNGTYGGSSSVKDGARVDFDWSGNATYANDGCQAPISTPQLSIINNDTTICPNATFNLSAVYSSDIVSIQWSSTNGTISNNTVNPTIYTNNTNSSGYIYLTSYTVCNDSIKDSISVNIATPINVQISAPNDSICSGQSITLTANGASSYLWNTGTNSNSISVNTTGDYTVIGSNTCYSDSDTIHIEVVPIPTISVSASSDTICSGQSAQLTANATISPITWNTGTTGNTITVNTQGTYTASVTNICGTFSDAVTITVIDTPNATISATDTMLCNGSSTLSFSGSNYDNNIWNTGSNNQSITVSNSGWYWVEVQNMCFTVRDSQYIYPAIIPNVTITASDTVLCNNETIVLTASGNYQYLWNTGETTNQITVNSAQTYTVVASNSCSSDTASIQIINGSITTDFSTSTDMGKAPLDVTCTNLSTNATAYSWYIDYQFINNNTNFSTIFENEGLYTITLIAENNFGCIDSTSKLIEVMLTTGVYIPNVFTPNNDGINDTFLIKGNNIDYYQMSIFNRWGQLLFEGNENQNWNGTNLENQIVPDGTYVYLIKVVYLNGVKEIFNGSVQKLE